MNTSKGTERSNDEGPVEVNMVETVDYRTPAGRDSEPNKEKVEVTHLVRAEGGDKPREGNVAAEAAGEVAEKLQAVKEAIFGDKGDKKTQ